MRHAIMESQSKGSRPAPEKILPAERKINMTHVFINREKNTIEISKSYNIEAGKYGSPQYDELLEIQKNHPGFRVIVVNDSRRRSIRETIKLDQIKTYVENHAGTDNEYQNELNELIKKSDKKLDDPFSREYAASFLTIKKWFFNTYPKLEETEINRKKQISDIMAKANARRKEYEKSLQEADAKNEA